jgi:hypothetical protein
VLELWQLRVFSKLGFHGTPCGTMSIAKSIILAIALSATLPGCSDNKPANPDAPVIKLTDAVRIDATPDALTCDLPFVACGQDCFDLQNDVANCGACGTACSGGQTCATGACACAPAFAPAMVTPTANDQVGAQQTIVLAIAPFMDSNGNHAVVLAYNKTGTPINTDIMLTEASLNSPPLMLLGYQVVGQSVKAAFSATSGKLRFTKACDKGATGTLTGAVFKGVKSLMPPFMIDANGCSFEVASLPFSIGKPDMCM